MRYLHIIFLIATGILMYVIAININRKNFY